jgi:hypothetical protein
VEGLLQFVQSGLRMHLTPGMSFETVQRHAHNLGVSLRQTIQQSVPPVTQKFPPGVKGLLPRGGSVQSVNSTETANLEDPQSLVDSPTIAALEAALANTHAGNSYYSPSGTPSGSSRQHWRPPMPRSPSPSVVSIPTRGWASPGGSVRSEPPARTGISKPILCFLCYEAGHYLAECPRLPAVLQREATANREAYQRNREAARQPIPTEVMSTRPRAQPDVLNLETAVSARDPPIEAELTSVEEVNSQEGSENLSGGN